ncbi:leucine-rich repeat domain-containing protein [Candidatus Woesearchaeota archaeon]|nr:leucine-rich repeat domain-containing protein [Candidatus Woesearchaeota archaeon]
MSNTFRKVLRNVGLGLGLVGILYGCGPKPEEQVDIGVQSHVPRYQGEPLRTEKIPSPEYGVLQDLFLAERGTKPTTSEEWWEINADVDTAYGYNRIGVVDGHVREIRLLYYHGSTLPESLSVLRELRTLIITQHNLVSLPESIGELSYLQRLNLDNTPQISWTRPARRNINFPESFHNLQNLTYLNLTGIGFDTAPEVIFTLEGLQELDLSYNYLVTLPDDIRGLENLKILDISDNELRSIPDWIGALVNLEELIVRGNHIAKPLPETAMALEKLQKVDFRGNSTPGYWSHPLPLPSKMMEQLEQLRERGVEVQADMLPPSYVQRYNNLRRLSLGGVGP